ncbi:MAG: hypothetical protein WCK63_14475 [Betaproteobacteria bacterium]
MAERITPDAISTNMTEKSGLGSKRHPQKSNGPKTTYSVFPKLFLIITSPFGLPIFTVIKVI